ncbi:MAG: DUF4263 domain-containing protein [Candidatus Delongbacteria bacterium]|nr:DUF4263 domain-containing protein [Candidatus Delongbacteria bacterium]MDD4205145.1 DUF4263 domain-containing protein [Candidatus Delongbacteria bacterium]
MDNYKTKSTSPNSAILPDPIVIEATGNTRKVLCVDLNDKKRDIGETVGITIVHQRKKGNDEWEDVKSMPLSSLKGGEGVRIDLNSHNTRVVYDHLSKLYALVKEKGIEFGTKDFTVAEANEIIKINSSRKTIIEGLISGNYTEEVWQELNDRNPDLATKFSLARIQIDRKKALDIFKENLERDNGDEAFWQDFFKANTWIFGYGLNYQFLDLLKDQPDYGGKNYTGKGSQKGDSLMNTYGDSKFTVLVEIKTPATKLLSYNKLGNPKIYRNDSWLLSADLLGAISQIQVNSRTWALNSQNAENIRDLEKKSIFTIEPKGILVIGNLEEVSRNESIASCFASFRRNTMNPEIITYDELYERARFIIEKGN